MSFHSWLQNLRSALAPGRGRRNHCGRGSCRAATRRLNLEALEDRLTPSFAAWGQFSEAEFYQMTGPDVRYSDPDTYLEGMYLQTGGFNEDGWNDLLTVRLWGGPYGEDPPARQHYRRPQDGTRSAAQVLS